MRTPYHAYQGVSPILRRKLTLLQSMVAQSALTMPPLVSGLRQHRGDSRHTGQHGTHTQAITGAMCEAMEHVRYTHKLGDGVFREHVLMRAHRVHDATCTVPTVALTVIMQHIGMPRSHMCICSASDRSGAHVRTAHGTLCLGQACCFRRILHDALHSP